MGARMIVLEAGPAGKGWRVAALVERRRMATGGRDGPAGWAMKAPRAVLVADASGIRAFSLSGAEMRPVEVERLCPGALAGFAMQAGGAGSGTPAPGQPRTGPS